MSSPGRENEGHHLEHSTNIPDFFSSLSQADKNMMGSQPIKDYSYKELYIYIIYNIIVIITIVIIIHFWINTPIHRRIIKFLCKNAREIWPTGP